MNPDPTPLPVELANGQGITVHLSYIRRDVDELKTSQAKWHTELLQRLNEMQALYPTRKEFDEVIKPINEMIADHEIRIRVIEKAMWKWVGIASCVGVTASILSKLIFNI